MQLKPLLLSLLLVSSVVLKAQADGEYSRISHLYTLGASFNSIKSYAGLGILFGFARFKNSEDNRYKWGFTLQHGDYYPYGITDVPNRYYTSTSVGYLAGLDLVKIKSFGIFLNGVVYADFYRNINDTNLYGLQPDISGGAEFGFRFSNPKKRYGFQLAYPAVRYGVIESFSAGVNFSLQVRLKK